MGFVAVVRIDLNLAEGRSLKDKRRRLVSLKSKLSSRYGAAVAEVGDHDLWQRARLLVAVVGPSLGDLTDHTEAIERYISAHSGGLISVERTIVSSEELAELAM